MFIAHSYQSIAHYLALLSFSKLVPFDHHTHTRPYLFILLPSPSVHHSSLNWFQIIFPSPTPPSRPHLQKTIPSAHFFLLPVSTCQSVSKRLPPPIDICHYSLPYLVTPIIYQLTLLTLSHPTLNTDCTEIPTAIYFFAADSSICSFLFSNKTAYFESFCFY